MKLSDIKTSSSRVEHGAWVTDLAFLPGVSLKVRAIGNSHYRTQLARIFADLTPEKRLEVSAADETEVILLSETILLDWHGIEDLPFSVENARMLLADPEMSIFRQAVKYAANVVAEDGQETLQADVKN